jgi:beta-glucanase (GH16 family)
MFGRRVILIGVIVISIVGAGSITGLQIVRRHKPAVREIIKTTSMNTAKPEPDRASTELPHQGVVQGAQIVSHPAQSSNPSPAQKPPVSTASYTMMDQFNGTTLDTNLWEAMTYPAGYRPKEEQDYRPSQVSVGGGYLRITASRDQNGAWHSGEVHSKWNYAYGEFEVRMAMSISGPGVWPAAWLMGTSDLWPNNGEIDIMENINGAPTVYGTIHGGGTNGHWYLQRLTNGIDVTKFHTYKIVKEAGYLSWWVDGVKYGEWQQSQTPAGGIWPFENHRYFGLLNLAVGGSWPGPSNTTTPSPLTMLVDYFSVKNGR